MTTIADIDDRLGKCCQAFKSAIDHDDQATADEKYAELDALLEERTHARLGDENVYPVGPDA